MIVTCPACAVRYVVDPRALGAKGRTVRCARCAHTWFEDAPPPSEEKPAARSAVPPPPVEPPPSADPPPREGAPALTAGRRVQLPALPPKKPRFPAAAAWALTVIVLLAGLGYAAIVEHDRVVALWPGAASLYARAGLATGQDGLGLEFRNLTTSREMENGLPALVVAGEVKNVSSTARAVPKLVVILRDSSAHDLQDLTVAAPADHLQPGESVPFHASIAQPAEAASDVFVTFAGAGRS